jgi:hypothetical protein
MVEHGVVDREQLDDGHAHGRRPFGERHQIGELAGTDSATGAE